MAKKRKARAKRDTYLYHLKQGKRRNTLELLMTRKDAKVSIEGLEDIFRICLYTHTRLVEKLLVDVRRNTRDRRA